MKGEWMVRRIYIGEKMEERWKGGIRKRNKFKKEERMR